MVQVGIGVPMPMQLPVTGLWMLPYSAYFVYLGGSVSKVRIDTKKHIGSSLESSDKAGQDALYLARRSHANFAEWVPFALVAAAVAELNGANRKFLHAALAALFASRVVHVELGMKINNGVGRGRTVGAVTTQSFLLAVGGYGAWLVKEYWGF